MSCSLERAVEWRLATPEQLCSRLRTLLLVVPQTSKGPGEISLSEAVEDPVGVVVPRPDSAAHFARQYVLVPIQPLLQDESSPKGAAAMIDDAGPRLTIGLVVGSERERAGRSLSCLLRQTALDQIEIVCVDLAPDTGALAGTEKSPVRSVKTGSEGLLEEAMAEVIDRARAPLVAFVEDHSYAEPEWAAEILREFDRTGAAMVNYAFTHAGSGTYLDRAFLVAEYGRWMVPARGREVPIAACNNVSYRVEILAPFRGRLADWLGVAPLLHAEIQRRGGVVWQATEAVVAHEGWASLRDGCWANGIMKRAFGGNRPLVGSWGVTRRLLYAAGMIIAPGLHLARLAWSFRDRPRLWGVFLSALPVCLAVYGYASYQEALGYLFGPGVSREAFTEMELGVPRQR